MTEKNSETLTLDEKLILLAKVAAGKKGVISSEELMNYWITSTSSLTPIRSMS